jgi:hypothetical protein
VSCLTTATDIVERLKVALFQLRLEHVFQHLTLLGRRRYKAVLWTHTQVQGDARTQTVPCVEMGEVSYISHNKEARKHPSVDHRTLCACLH